MMRKIKFRGKDRDGNWVYGYFVYKETIFGKRAIIIQDFIPCIDDINENKIINFEVDKWRQVIPETVGQFTGLYDKNNKEIYEGDIVKYYVLTLKDYYKIGVIKFERGSFYIEGIKEWIADDVSVNELPFFSSRNLEVIGNVYDNPGLLEEIE